MTILDYVRKLLKTSDSNPELEYVQELKDPVSAFEVDGGMPIETCDSEDEVDLANLTDLEAYARGSQISKKSIEQWISSGLLMPYELKVAEKLIKMMNRI